MSKEKTEYPELKLDNKKATTNQQKVEWSKQFLESILTVELNKTSDRERMLREMNILNDKDLKTVDVNENRKRIENEEFENN